MGISTSKINAGLVAKPTVYLAFFIIIWLLVIFQILRIQAWQRSSRLWIRSS